MTLENLVIIPRFHHRKVNLMQVCDNWIHMIVLYSNHHCSTLCIVILYVLYTYQLIFDAFTGAVVSSASDLSGASYKSQVGKVNIVDAFLTWQVNSAI